MQPGDRRGGCVWASQGRPEQQAGTSSLHTACSQPLFTAVSRERRVAWAQLSVEQAGVKSRLHWWKIFLLKRGCVSHCVNGGLACMEKAASWCRLFTLDDKIFL